MKMINSPLVLIPIKPCGSLVVLMASFDRFLTLSFLNNHAVASCLVTFSALRPNPSIGGASRSLYDTVPLAYNPIHRYIDFALSKISRLVLADYKLSKGAYSPHWAFFVRNISMRSHISMAKLWRDTFEYAGNLLSLSANPLQLCHLNYLAVIGKAPKSKGAHSHA